MSTSVTVTRGAWDRGAAARPILPGATLGILGGGQLGRMTALAARALGYRLRVLDPDPHCAAAGVVDEVVVGDWDDPAAAARLAAGSDVVTLEIERVGPRALAAAARHAPVRPGGAVLDVVRDRGLQKNWLVRHGFPVAPFAVVASEGQLPPALAGFGPRCYVKTCRDGYDGRGQALVTPEAPRDGLWQAFGGRPLIVESAIELAAELSVLVARRPSGGLVVYEPALNTHRARVLDWSVLPAPVPRAVAEDAQAIARGLAGQLGLEGILVVELFLDRAGRLLVNELAPRPHNSYHGATEGCATSQYEQLVRAVCDLPLGAPDVLRPAAIANLLGDLWQDGTPPDTSAALAVPGTRVHVYGKAPRPGRKLGHVAATAPTGDEAVARALAARRLLELSRREAPLGYRSRGAPEPLPAA